MKTMPAENIRRFRKERSPTQEQLAEALGVTAGAVYKWEAKLSIPELELILQMADFFDTSADVLLGYEVKDNRLEATVKRLQAYRRQKDPDELLEAEKALGKYPHSFQIVDASAALAGSQLLSGQREEARDTLLKAKELAAFFDTSPSYDESDIRFVDRIEGASAHDDLGATAMDGVRCAVNQFDNEELTALWESVAAREGLYE